MEHEKFEGERTLMRIHIGESDKWHGKALYDALVDLFRSEGLSGATVLARRCRLRFDQPLSHGQDSCASRRTCPSWSKWSRIPSASSSMLPKLDEMIGGGLITLERVRVILYRSHK